MLSFSLALCFYVSPKIVIFSWLCSSNLGNQILKSSPKINFFKNWVHPTIDNAISSIKLSSMMPVVFLMTQNQSGRLKKSDDSVWLSVDHMSPFVNFIGKNS